MNDEQQKLEVYETSRFSKALNKMDDRVLALVEDEIEKIIDDPLIGKQKKGDLSYLRVHKFGVDSQNYLLGYSWDSGKLNLFLLSIGSHENFYRDAANRRKADLQLIKP